MADRLMTSGSAGTAAAAAAAEVGHNTAAAAGDAGRLLRSQSTSHLTRCTDTDAAAETDVDLVSIQTALRRFLKQLITAQMHRVS